MTTQGKAVNHRFYKTNVLQLFVFTSFLFIKDDLDSELDIQSHHEDDEELESPVSPRPRPVRETTLARNQQDLDAEEMLDYEADILAGIDRFSDSSSDSEHGHGNLVDGNDSDNDSNTSPFFYTRQSQNVNSCIQQRKDY